MTDATNGIVQTGLTPSVIVQNITNLLADLESNQIRRATGALIRYDDYEWENRSPERASYCCLGRACKIAGLELSTDCAGFLDSTGQRQTALPPQSICYALGFQWIDEKGSFEIVKMRDLPRWHEGEFSECEGDTFVNTIMGLNDGAEHQMHWETGAVISRFQMLRDFWQVKADERAQRPDLEFEMPTYAYAVVASHAGCLNDYDSGPMDTPDMAQELAKAYRDDHYGVWIETPPNDGQIARWQNGTLICAIEQREITATSDDEEVF